MELHFGLPQDAQTYTFYNENQTIWTSRSSRVFIVRGSYTCNLQHKRNKQHLCNTILFYDEVLKHMCFTA